MSLNKKGLNNFLRMLDAEKLPMAKVGVLGRTDTRKDQSTNAEIGLRHEFGTDKLPMRSFLRMPLTENFQKYVNKSKGFFDEKLLEKLANEQSLEGLVRILGTIGESIVIDGFDTGGFGRWKPSNMKYKKVQQTLIESQQLRDSITHEVE